MIADVMDIGRIAEPDCKPVSPEFLIETALNDIFSGNPNTDLEIQYEFQHEYMIYADALKMNRVFSNIILNSLEAINGKGKIWFSTYENTDTFLTTFCIGNSGSYIPEEDIPMLFDAFYTKNKSGGTGLGLAIAEKIVIAHGGQIWCKSSKEKKRVEFYFSLPVAKECINTKMAKLPQNSQEFVKKVSELVGKKRKILDSGITEPRLHKFEKKIEAYVKTINRKIKLCIVDDESLYRNALVELIKRSNALRNSVDTFICENSDKLFDVFATNKPDCLICDVDLNSDQIDGFQIVEKLRSLGYCQPICMHSNRSLPEDYEKSVKAGAQAFLPKPMTRDHLIKFIVDTIPTQAMCLLANVGNNA